MLQVNVAVINHLMIKKKTQQILNFIDMNNNKRCFFNKFDTVSLCLLGKSL